MPKTINSKGTVAERPARNEPKSNKGSPEGTNIPIRYRYALTLRHNPKYDLGGVEYTEREKRILYANHLEWMEQKGLIFLEKVYEKKNGLHLHALVQYPKKLYFKRFSKHPWHALFKEIYDEKGWLSYIRKESVQEEQKAIMEYYSNNYGFRD